jgi:hypothetical protein
VGVAMASGSFAFINGAVAAEMIAAAMPSLVQDPRQLEKDHAAFTFWLYFFPLCHSRLVSFHRHEPARRLHNGFSHRNSYTPYLIILVAARGFVTTRLFLFASAGKPH